MGLIYHKIMKEFFTEVGNKTLSSARLIFVLGMLWAMIVSTLLTIFMGWSAGEFIAVFTAQSGVFIGLKLGQKPMEKK